MPNLTLPKPIPDFGFKTGLTLGLFADNTDWKHLFSYWKRHFNEIKNFNTWLKIASTGSGIFCGALVLAASHGGLGSLNDPKVSATNNEKLIAEETSLSAIVNRNEFFSHNTYTTSIVDPTDISAFSYNSKITYS